MKLLIILLVIFISLQYCDYITTVTGLEMDGVTEGNPLMAKVANFKVEFFLLKTVCIAIVLVSCWVIKDYLILTPSVIGGLDVLYFYTMMNNLVIIMG